MQNTSSVAMQQQEVSEPPELCESDYKDLESNIDKVNIPKEDSSFMKEEGTFKNDNPSLEAPIIEEAVMVEPEKITAEDGLCTNEDKSEDALSRNDSQYCEPHSEVEHDKDLTDKQSASDGNYEQIIENNIHVDEENVEIEVEEATNHCEANGFIEEPEKGDCLSSNSELCLKEGEDAHVNEEVADEVLFSNGETADPDPGTQSSSVSVSNNEVPQTKSRDLSEDESLSENITSPGNGSWGGKIRSVSARRPVRKPSVPPESLLERSRSNTPNYLTSTPKVYSQNDTCNPMTESLFSSLKRKTYDIEKKATPKKARMCDPQNSTFLSMVSSPLRLLKNKISDRILESPKDTSGEKHINGNSEDVNEECEAKNSVEITDKKSVVAESKIQDSYSRRSWCSIM